MVKDGLPAKQTPARQAPAEKRNPWVGPHMDSQDRVDFFILRFLAIKIFKRGLPTPEGKCVRSVLKPIL